MTNDDGLAALCSQLKGHDVAHWQRSADALVRSGRYALAARLLERALQRFPGRVELQMRQGESWQLAGDGERALRVLDGLARRHPADAAVAFSLAHVLREQGRYDAAARQVARCARQDLQDAIRVARCAQFAMQCQRDELAHALCEEAAAAGTADARVLALAGRTALVMGDFERARTRLLEAVERGVNRNESFVALLLSMAQRYGDAAHPDFALFERLLRDPGLLPPARAATLLALGKAFDEVGDAPAAVRALREGNALLRAARPWSRADWAQQVERQRAAAPLAANAEADASFNPVFIVGMPRSGTTLIAERLGRDARVRNRDESAWLPQVAALLADDASPERLAQAARLYRTHLRQDDAPAQWHVDKNPLNFRHLGVAAALFPNLRVVWCRRGARDTALSIWGHFFGNPDNGYARDLGDIAAVTRDCERLMRHWCENAGVPVLPVDYEDVVAQPEAMLARVRGFVGLGEAATATASADAGPRQAIVTASTWQARQPVYAHAVERWRPYAPHLPELLDAFPDPA